MYFAAVVGHSGLVGSLIRHFFRSSSRDSGFCGGLLQNVGGAGGLYCGFSEPDAGLLWPGAALGFPRCAALTHIYDYGSVAALKMSCIILHCFEMY